MKSIGNAMNLRCSQHLAAASVVHVIFSSTRCIGGPVFGKVFDLLAAVRSLRRPFSSFLKFVMVLLRFQKASDVFGCLCMGLDGFGCVWMHSEVFRCI